MKNFLKWFCLPMVYMLLINCKVENIEQQTLVPFTRVNFEINLNIYANLKITGTHEIISQGVQGIVIYNTGAGFKAYDLACPYITQADCSKPMVFNNTSLTCSDCGNSQVKFSLAIPFANYQNTRYGMQQYLVTQIDANTLRITNF